MRFELVAERSFPIDKKEIFTEKLLEAAKGRNSKFADNTNDDSEEKYRKMEYDAILTESGGENQQFLVSKKSSREYE